jgi:hypothetical protein
MLSNCNYSVVFFSLPERQDFHNRRSTTCGCEPKRPLPERQDFNPFPLPLLFKNPAFQAAGFYHGTTAGQRPAVMKMKPYRAIPLNSHKKSLTITKPLTIFYS